MQLAFFDGKAVIIIRKFR